MPKIYNLRTDPFERADITSNTYYDWFLDHAYLVFAAQALVGAVPADVLEFPPRQKPASFTIDQALEKLEAALRRATDDEPTRSPRGRTARRGRAIVDFVERVTAEGGPDYVPPPERIAVFDNDGTLWCEKPMPIELGFILHRLAAMAEADAVAARAAAVEGGARAGLRAGSAPR